jgi:5'-phosphate synthase pdxT subunit
MSPVIGVLALQGAVDEHLRAIGEAGASGVAVRRPGELDAVDGLIIPGGESTTMWKLTVIFELLDPLRKRLGAGLPVFGSCAGMIMLADRLVDRASGQETLGGIGISVRRNAFGRQVDSFERDVTLRLGDNADSAPFHAVFIRAPSVAQAGPGVAVLGEDNGRIIAVRHGVLLATAFHPELTPDLRIHELFVSMVKGTS